MKSLDVWDGRLAEPAEVIARAVKHGDGQPRQRGGVAYLLGKGPHADPGTHADREPGAYDEAADVPRQFGAGAHAGNADFKRSRNRRSRTNPGIETPAGTLDEP